LKPSPASRKGSTGHSRLTELIDILDLEQIEQNVFRGRHQVENRNRLYGGQIMAQVLVAAGRPVTAAHFQHEELLRLSMARQSLVWTRRLVQRQEDIIAVQCLAKAGI